MVEADFADDVVTIPGVVTFVRLPEELEGRFDDRDLLMLTVAGVLEMELPDDDLDRGVTKVTVLVPGATLDLLVTMPLDVEVDFTIEAVAVVCLEE